MKKAILLLSILLSTSVVNAASAPPFSDAVKVGNILYLSGQIGSSTLGEPPVAGGIVPETHQAMKNIKDVLAKYGSSVDQLAKCTIMLADIREWSQMNEVYASYFPTGRYPARSAFGATGLAYNARVEIECIATTPT
ncbi:MAG: RidA family protein [Gammaproteobacteria bacterium]|nr:RidA family protein [Gammaproteobacteria bacterium]